METFNRDKIVKECQEAPQSWVAEGIFGSLGRFLRLSKDYRGWKEGKSQ